LDPNKKTFRLVEKNPCMKKVLLKLGWQEAVNFEDKCDLLWGKTSSKKGRTMF